MSQLRLDPLTGRWVVVSLARAERPFAFASRSMPVETGPGRPCPFCPGHEEATPAALENYGSGGTWQVRVLPNLYPAFSGADPMVVTHLGPIFTQAPASGIHEVLVLDRAHGTYWADLTGPQAELVMSAIRDRVESHARTPGLRCSQAIVNYGREAGASLEHGHGQLLAIPFVPREISDELAGFARFRGSCLLCTTLEAESGAGHRIVSEDELTAVLCPFWSGTPFEMLIVPRAHDAHLHTAEPTTLTGVGRALQAALARLREAVGDVAYNLVFHAAPYRVDSDYHWHVHVLPKLTTRAGFELGTGVQINVLSPELAARALRDVA